MGRVKPRQLFELPQIGLLQGSVDIMSGGGRIGMAMGFAIKQCERRLLAILRRLRMRPDDVLQLLRARPFQPFRISLSDGQQYEVRHPEIAIVSRSTVLVGIPGPRGPDGPVERVVTCALLHITRMELLNGASTAT